MPAVSLGARKAHFGRGVLLETRIRLPAPLLKADACVRIVVVEIVGPWRPAMRLRELYCVHKIGVLPLRDEVSINPKRGKIEPVR